MAEGGVLPPAVQEFVANATKWLAGVDEMIAADDRLLASIEQVMAAQRDMGVTGAGAAGGTVEAAEAAGARDVAIADKEAAVAADELAAANDRVAESAVAAADSTRVEAGASREAGGAAESMAAKGKMAFLGVAVAVGVSIDKAVKFQAEMTRLQTAAGLTGVNMQKVSNAVLQIGDRTGYAGTQIAEALYHPISAGLDLKTSLELVAQSAELAQIHGASLEDTTYALSSVMKAYNLSAGQTAKTSALLNSIVGQGDMRFQDFIQSVKNWTPTGAAMGISIQSMGAALGYLTDRGNSAEVASTRLTMGLSMVTAGSKAANTYLSALGLTTGTLTLRNKTLQQVMLSAGLTTNKIAADLRKPDGIYVALTHIQEAFRKAGLSASQADEVMAKIFGGGRSDKAMVSLMQNLDGVRQKYDSIGKAAGGFGSSWAKTQKTVAFEMKQTRASVDNLAISFGSVLLPAVDKILGIFNKFLQVMQKSPVLRVMVGALLAVAAAMGLLAAASAALTAVLAINPFVLALAAVIALAIGLYELYRHCQTFRDAVRDVANALKTAWNATFKAAGEVVKWFVNGPLAFIKHGLQAFSDFWKQNGQEITKIAKTMWTTLADIFKIGWGIISGIFKAAFDILKGFWKAGWDIIIGVLKIAWNLVRETISTGVHVILDIIGAALQLIQGHWRNAWNDIKAATGTLLHGLLSMVRTILSGLVSILYQAGANAIRGLINGIQSMLGAVVGAAENIASSVEHAITGALHIFSPSRVMYEHGVNTVLGFVNGILATTPQVAAAMRRIGLLTATGTGTSASLTGGQYQPRAALAGSAAGGQYGGGGNVIVYVTVQGSVISQQQLQQAIQQEALRYTHRNQGNGLFLAGRKS